MAEDSRRALFLGALVFSVSGLALLLLTDFGGWYEYHGGYPYDYGYRTYDYISVWESPLYGLGLLVLSIPLMACVFTSLRGLQNPGYLSRRKVSLAFGAAILQMCIVVVGAIVFVAAVGGADDWWLGAGFYGSAVGAFLTILFLAKARTTYVDYPYPFGPVPNVYGGYQYFPQNPLPAYPQDYAHSSQQPYGPQIQPQEMSLMPPAPMPQYYGQSQPQPSPVPGAAFCTNCGHPIPPGDTFCSNCGQRV
jgi:hypothetical protein